MIRLMSGFIAIAVIAVSFVHGEAGGRTSEKGWELYVWKSGGDTHFALLAGTNRLKSAAEIEKDSVTKIDEAEMKLDRLAAKETVNIVGHSLQEPPPEKEAEALAEYGKKLGLTMFMALDR